MTRGWISGRIPGRIRATKLASALAVAVALQGCAAALVPIAAAALGGTRLGRDGERLPRAQAEPVQARVPAQVQPPVVASGQTPPPAASDEGAVTPGLAAVLSDRQARGEVPATMQYLYGSGEAAALSTQVYNALALHLRASADLRESGAAAASVVLAPGSTLTAPRFTSCDAKPLAVILDVDETVLLNLGYEADEAKRGLAYDEARWRRWEATGVNRVAAVPGAVAAVAAARKAGIAVIFISNRSVAGGAATARALAGAGLGAAVPGDTLLLRGDNQTGGKDARRAQAAAKYCVVALAGDQLGDFSDLFGAENLPLAQRRTAATGVQFRPLWGDGWFVLPNPVYGSAVKGTIDDVFPQDKRWVDSGAAGE